MDILVKVSGDLVVAETFYNWLSSTITSLDKVVVLCGGGSAITEALKENDISFSFGPGGREIESEKGRRLALQVLQKQKVIIEEKLQEKGMKADVLIPVIEVGRRIYHINGDSYAISLYPNFDKIFIVTLEGRTKFFPDNLEKIKVVHL